jgi:hypothetical protein
MQIRTISGLSYAIHRSAWKSDSRKFVCDILNEMEHRDFLELPEAPAARSPYHNILGACIKMRRGE